MSESEKIEFPYGTFAEAKRDKFAKIGGPDAAFRFLAKGFKTAAWRKRAEANAKRLEAEEDERFAKER